MTDETTLLKFPCHFPIKLIGKHTETYIAEILALTQQFFPTFSTDNIKHNHSKNKNYIALTLTVYAHDKASLDKLYHQLSAHPDSKMVL
ncbi:MAG: DUF493 domain-containing protein [Gammaproteobacteria bacterium]|nr:DUF493 domain-containing protein [Gammaproteobacteria bacterium]